MIRNMPSTFASSRQGSSDQRSSIAAPGEEGQDGDPGRGGRGDLERRPGDDRDDEQHAGDAGDHAQDPVVGRKGSGGV
jgi:hypothetical protein